VKRLDRCPIFQNVCQKYAKNVLGVPISVPKNGQKPGKVGQKIENV
jgi:hypothetical protein